MSSATFSGQGGASSSLTVKEGKSGRGSAAGGVSPSKRSHHHHPPQHNHPPHNHNHQRKNRQSPEGREREFPATRVGPKPSDLQVQASPRAGGLSPGDEGSTSGTSPDPTPSPLSLGGDTSMGAGDERFFHQQQSSSSGVGGQSAAGAGGGGGGAGGGGASGGGLRCASQIGQSSNFHYTLQDHQQYGTAGANGGGGRSSGSSRQSRQQADSYHSPHVSSGSRSRAGSRELYLDSTGKGTLRSNSSSGLRQHQRSAQQQEYMLLRHQEPQIEFDRLQSNSRSELLENDHNAAMFDMSAGAAPTPYVTLPPPRPYEIFRDYDGKFMRTTYINDYNHQPVMDHGGHGGYNQSQAAYNLAAAVVANRNAAATLRRPTKSSRRAAQAVSSGTDAYGNNCCPRDEFALVTQGGGGTSSRRSNHQMSMSSMPYATLGRKWTEKQRAGVCPAPGIGDNYGRNGMGYPPADDSRSLASYTDDSCLSISSYHDGAAMGHGMISGHGGMSSAAAAAALAHQTRMMSRSTDRNLDSLSDEDLLLQHPGGGGGGSGLPMRTSEEMLASLLTREPPDGKEKPEPASKGIHKLEHAPLSRKSSKCDLLDSNSGSGRMGSLSSNNNNAGVNNNDCRSEAASMCGETSSVLSGVSALTVSQQHSSVSKTDSGVLVSGAGGPNVAKRDSLTNSSSTMKDSVFLDNSHCSSSSSSAASAVTTLQQQHGQDQDIDSGLSSSLQSSTNKDWKSVPGSPRCSTLNAGGVGVMGGGLGASSSGATATSPKAAIITPPSSAPNAAARIAPPMASVAPPARSLVSYSQGAPYSSQTTTSSVGAAQLATTPSVATPVTPSTSTGIQGALHRSYTYVIVGTAKFFGVDAASEKVSHEVWNDRRRRIAIKKFGGVKDEYALRDGVGLGANGGQYGQYSGGGGGGGGGDARFRTFSDQHHHLTSEPEGDKMVLKITKPPRNKDSLGSLTGQGISYIVNSLMVHKVPIHQIVAEHDVSRSYQPSMTGIAAYYQAEQSGGLAVCPPPLPRVPSNHHLHGESPAEEVFFTKPSCDGEDHGIQKRMPYNADPYRPCATSWQLPRPDQPHDLPPRMSSDVGASRIWNRLLDAAFDNSDRRKHGMGVVGRVLSGRRRVITRHAPESNRKRKLGGNANDHRPYFTYWITMVQILVMLISMIVYGVGPLGVDLYKKNGMVLVTNLELEAVGHLEPANFWIGPSATALIHLGAKYSPCMRWDEVLDRDIKAERLKERDTACCIRKDRAGCVQSPKTECSKVGRMGGELDDDGGPNGGGGGGSVGGVPPRSNWWRPSEWYSKYPNENRRSSGPVCGLDPAYCEAPASVAPYIWPDDITKWPICRRKTDVENLDQMGHTAEHMICEIIGHPCCIGIRGQCKITTREYCLFVGGTFHEEAALCSQVSCLDDVCGLLPFRNRDVPDQFYRTWTPLFLHAGVIHLAITVALHFWLMRDLEKMAGASRIAIIYLGAGMIGNLASAIFVPYRAEVGPAGAHFGLLACCMVEVIHQWPMLKYPEMAILKLVGVTAVLFLAGLLPWVDNYAHLFGFISGFLLSYALLPFVTFGGEYERKRKVILVWICLLSVLFLFVGLLLLFYVTPIHDCEICKYFNCIPITKDFCADQNIDLMAVEM